MRLWVGRNSGQASALPKKTRSRCVERCVTASKMLVGVLSFSDESDAGYVSQYEEDEMEMKLVTREERHVSA